MHGIEAQCEATPQRPARSSSCGLAAAPRVSFLVKVFFGRRMRRSNLEALLDQLEAKTQSDVHALIAVHDGLDSGRFRFERLTARHGILIKQARLAWTTEARATFELAGEDG